jgi:hypothetical protein
MRRWAVAIALAAIGVGTAAARLIPSWPYDKLFREADLVVLARPVSSADSGEVASPGGWKVEFLGVNTKFEAKAVLKGKLEGGRLTVLHHRLPDGISIKDGPWLVSFRLRGLAVETKAMKAILPRPDYLLFLKRRADGRYEPVSGPVDPELSVREVMPPCPPGWAGPTRTRSSRALAGKLPRPCSCSGASSPCRWAAAGPGVGRIAWGRPNWTTAATS